MAKGVPSETAGVGQPKAASKATTKNGIIGKIGGHMKKRKSNAKSGETSSKQNSPSTSNSRSPAHSSIEDVEEEVYYEEEQQDPDSIDPDSVKVKGHWHPTYLKICGVRICHVSTASVVALLVELLAQLIQIGYGAWAWHQPKHLYEVDEPATQGTLAIIVPAEKLCAILFDFLGPATIIFAILVAFAGMAMRSCKLLIPHALMQLVSVVGLLLQCFVTVVTPMEYRAELINKARIFEGYIPGHVVPYHKGKLFGICFCILCCYTVGILLQVWFIEILKHYFFYLVDQTNYWPDSANTVAPRNAGEVGNDGEVAGDVGSGVASGVGRGFASGVGGGGGGNQIHPETMNGMMSGPKIFAGSDFVIENDLRDRSDSSLAGLSSKKSSINSKRSERSARGSQKRNGGRKGEAENQQHEDIPISTISTKEKLTSGENRSENGGTPGYTSNVMVINGGSSEDESDNEISITVGQNIEGGDVNRERDDAPKPRSRNVGADHDNKRVMKERF